MPKNEPKPENHDFPKPMKFKRLLGPSFLVLATGIGSGEIILWPLIASEYGLGLVWVALIGITFQYFINMEIERYSLVKGESVFKGMERLFPWAPHWLIFSTFFTFAIPGTAAASAQIIGHVFGIEQFQYLGIAFLLLMGIIVSIGRTVYQTLEKTVKFSLLVLIPAVLIFVIYVSNSADWVALGQGFIAKGDGYTFIPAGISIAALFGAFAYSGSGGNLNLAQSSYIQEKGYGMGKYAPKIKSLFSKEKHEKVKLSGVFFESNDKNIKNFKTWWKQISLEHLIVFWFLGFLMILVFMLMAHVTITGQGEGIHFVLSQGQAIAKQFFPWMGSAFLIIIGLIMFESQLGIYDSASRIISENYAIKTNKVKINISKLYYVIVWSQIFLGIVLFSIGYYEPKSLIILAAILNAFGMFVHVGLVNYMNHKTLRKPFQASIYRKLLMLLIFIVFGVFSIFTILHHLL